MNQNQSQSQNSSGSQQGSPTMNQSQSSSSSQQGSNTMVASPYSMTSGSMLSGQGSSQSGSSSMQSGQGSSSMKSGQSSSQSSSSSSGQSSSQSGSGQMSAMTEQVIATDLLMATKSGIRNYAIAISECATPELRDALTSQLNDTIRSHEQITDYMVSKGYYHPVDVLQQLNVDEQAAQTAINLQ